METIKNSAWYCGNVFLHISTWIIGKDSMKRHCLTINEFYSSLKMEGITDADFKHADFKNLNEVFIQNYNVDSDKGYILDVNVDYPKEMQKEQ